MKMEAVYTLNRRQYDPNPHCVAIPEQNQHQKINLLLFLITQHAMHTYLETSIISQTCDYVTTDKLALTNFSLSTFSLSPAFAAVCFIRLQIITTLFSRLADASTS
jgi:hypothetical protein